MLAAISTGCSIPDLESNFSGIFHGIWGAGFCWFVASLGMSASCRPTRAVVSLYFAMVCNNRLLKTLSFVKKGDRFLTVIFLTPNFLAHFCNTKILVLKISLKNFSVKNISVKKLKKSVLKNVVFVIKLH